MTLHSLKWLVAFLYGLLIIWTGLLRGIEAQAYKPNALWFCSAMGLLAIAAAILFRVNRHKLAILLVVASAAIVLAFYLNCFITKPEGDANIRVARAILGSIAMIVVALMPSRPSL